MGDRLSWRNTLNQHIPTRRVGVQHDTRLRIVQKSRILLKNSINAVFEA